MKVFLKNVLTSVAVAIVIASCSHDDDELVDTSTPAYHIDESEKLVIPESVKLPDNLPNGNTRVFTFYADGVQKYKAQEIPNSNPVAYQWVFVAPQADLYDVTNKKVGDHSAGPTWQLSIVDSMFGQAFTPPRSAPGTDANSIDWLLLMPKTGKPPIGAFAEVDYVQRIHTEGGKAPATPPTSPTQIENVHYTAIYRFSKINP